jgi:hypothetical protein
VDDPAVTHHGAASGRSNDFTERGNSILKRHDALGQCVASLRPSEPDETHECGMRRDSFAWRDAPKRRSRLLEPHPFRLENSGCEKPTIAVSGGAG